MHGVAEHGGHRAARRTVCWTAAAQHPKLGDAGERSCRFAQTQMKHQVIQGTQRARRMDGVQKCNQLVKASSSFNVVSVPYSMRSATLGALAGGEVSLTAPGSRSRFRVRRDAASTAGRFAAGASADGSARLRTAVPAGGSAGDGASRGGSARMSASTRAALPKAVGRPHSGRATEARCVALCGTSTSCVASASVSRRANASLVPAHLPDK